MGIKLVVFGLSISSSWGNGHATLWRALCKSMAARGHHVVFFERDVPYYAAHRDAIELPGVQLVLYQDWDEALPLLRKELNGADVGMVTSYCPDAAAASDLVLSSRGIHAFYDLDAPITLARVRKGEPVSYIGPCLLREFDVVFSYAGGRALTDLQSLLGARRVYPLYGSVDPEVHFPVASVEEYRADLSYLGTYAEDRQSALQTLLLEPAGRLPDKRFLVGGPLYPPDFPWTGNSCHRPHVPPSDHPAFYSSSLITLNVTRGPMAETGYCPSGRLFEAAACGTPILSDWWEGLDDFFEPGREIIVGRTAEDAIDALGMSHSELCGMARAARERTLSMHTAEMRVRDFETALGAVH